MRYAATSTNPGKTYECPAADDDYNAGAAALGPSLIMAANHPDTTQFWDYVILGLVASSRWDVQWNRYDASVAERAGRAEGKLSLTLGRQSASLNEAATALLTSNSRTKPAIRVGSARCSAQGRSCFSSTLAR